MSLEQNISYGDLQEYTDTWFPSGSRVIGEPGSSAVQMFFLTSTRDMFVAVLGEYIFIMLGELTFENSRVKTSDLFC